MLTITAPSTQPHPPTIARAVPIGTQGTFYITRNGLYLDKHSLSWSEHFTPTCLFHDWPTTLEALAQVN